MPNIDLTCVECQNQFYFSERDQAFYAEREFQTPKRCFTCRQKRKQNGSQGAPQQNFAAEQDDRGNRSQGRRRQRDDY